MSSRRHSSSLFWIFAVFSAIALLSSAIQVTRPHQAAAAASGLERLIAPPSACPGQGDAAAPAGRQERAMRCLANYARRRSGLEPLAAVAKLARSSGLKSGDMLRCDDFDHEACGRDFTYWIERVGYLASSCGAAENIALGSGSLATPRSIFQAWIGSAGHRRNILGRFDDLGVGLQVGALGGDGDVHVWTQHFGRRCGSR